MQIGSCRRETRRIAGFWMMGLGRRGAPLGLRQLACAAGLLLGASVAAGGLTHFQLQSRSDGYHLEARGLIEAPRAAVVQVLKDYADLYRISPRIIESELVSVSPDGVARVRTLNRLCFLAYCRDLRHLQLIRELGDGAFESHSVAEESDLSRGYARWRLQDLGETTQLDIDFSFAMDSYAWVPSFLSRFVARSALETDTRALISGIERAVGRREDRSGGD